MAARRIIKPAAPGPSREELTTLIEHALDREFGLNLAALKKLAPKSPAVAVECARALAERGRVFRFVRGKTELYFAAEPMERLDQIAKALLKDEPLPERELKGAVTRVSPHLASLFAEWKKSALARRVLFVHVTSKKAKLLSSEPDLHRALAPVVKAFEKAAAALARLDVERTRVLAVLWEVLGGKAQDFTPVERVRQVKAEPRTLVLQALGEEARQNPPGALLLIKNLRARVDLDKARFDQAVLELAREGRVSLHYHDYPESLSEAERAKLVVDERGHHYLGVVGKGEP